MIPRLHYIPLFVFAQCVFLPTLSAQSKLDIQGHWLQLPDDPSITLECPDELRFTSNDKFFILNQCDINDEIQQTASGEYQMDQEYLIFKNIMFTSSTRSFFTEEYSRIVLRVAGDTLEINIHRNELYTEKYIRI